jgi:AcrR family transcriptional regulator
MTPKQARNTTRLREAAAASRAETRKLLIAAAGEEFARVGYVAATVNRIAEIAGVTVQTLYLACGSKRALLRAYAEKSLQTPPAWSGQYHAAQLNPGNPPETLAQIAKLFCDTARRMETAWRAYRDGAAVDTAIAEELRELEMMRHGTFTAMLESIPDDAMRLTRSDAIDTVWAVASPVVYEAMTSHAGYTLERFQEWLTTTLRHAILHDPDPDPAPTS